MVGPLAGGFIAQTVGIEYVFYAIAAICGVASLFAIPFLRETYAPVILSRKDISASDPEKAPAVHSGALQDPRNKCKWKHLITNMLRPAVILTHSFICFILSLYMALSVISDSFRVLKLINVQGVRLVSITLNVRDYVC